MLQKKLLTLTPWVPRFPRQLASVLLRVAEVVSVVLVGCLFVRPFVNLDVSRIPAGREFEANAGWIGVGRKALLEYAELPLWNHHLGTGLPYLADPFSHFFNPLALIPALIWGPINGPKMAVVATILASGLTQYYFASVLGLSAPARVFSALVYMMNGQMMVRFGFGHYDFGLAYPYMPLAYALLIKAIQTRRGVLYPLLGGASVAGLVFAGNVYYLVFSLPGLILTGIVYVVRPQPRLRFHFDAVGFLRAATTASWAVALSAIQWLPWVASRQFVAKDPDPYLKGSPTIMTSLQTLFRSDRAFYMADTGGILPGLLHEYYAYIGILLIPLFVLSPLALFTPRRRAFLLAAGLFWFYVLWASAAHSPFQYVYDVVPRLYDFRHTSRQMAQVMPFAGLLVGLAIDAMWSLLPQAFVRVRASLQSEQLRWAKGVLAAGIALYGWFALKDVYTANQVQYSFVPPNPVHSAVAAWLQQDTDRPFLFDLYDGSWGVPPTFQQSGLKKSRAVWGWRLGKTGSPLAPDEPGVQLLPPPRYVIQLEGVPQRDDASLVAIVEDRSIFRLANAPPYAGFVRRAEAASHPDAFAPPLPGGFSPWPFADITEARANWPSTNQVRVEGRPTAMQDMLLVLESYAPGWRVEIDGKPVGEADNFGGLIATRALPGEHTYLFVFDPPYARRAVAVTLGAMAAAALLLLQSPAWWLVSRVRR